MYQKAPIWNPAFEGLVSVDGLVMYGVITTGTSFNTGIIQHQNRLKFVISNNLNGLAFGETKLAIDSTTIYLNQETYCMGDVTFSAGVNGLISSMVG